MGPGKEVMAKSIDTGVTAGSTRLYYAVGFSAAAHAAVVAGVTKVGITESVSYGQAVTGDAPTQFSATNNLDGLHLVTAKGVTGFGSYVEIATPASFVLSGSFETLTVINQFPLYLQGVHDVTAVIDTNYLAPEGLEGFHQFRKIHALLEPVALQGGTQEPRVTLSWCAPHEFPTTADSKSFPITPLNTRERTTQIVVDLYNNQMSSQGQGLRLKLTYPQIFGRFTLYWFSVDYNDIGNDNLMMYQRANS